MYILLGILASFMLGVSVSFFDKKANCSGTLHVHSSDDNNEPYLFLNIKRSMQDITERKYVIFEVHNDKNSHK